MYCRIDQRPRLTVLHGDTMTGTSHASEHQLGAGMRQPGSHPHGSRSTERHGPAMDRDTADQARGPDHGGSGHDKHAGHSVETFREKFGGTLLLSIPTVIWSPMIQHWFGYEAPGGPVASRWIPAVFGTLVFAYGGWVFIQGAVSEIRDRLPGMMTLISLAITVAFGFSLAVTFGFPGSDLWWERAMLVTIMVLGHGVVIRSISPAQVALKELAELLPDTAVRLVGDRTEDVAVSELRVGDVVLVRPGASIPADGVVKDGSSDVNESMITGESRPVRKEVDARVIAGTVNGSGSLRVEVTGTGERTALAGIMRLVAEAQSSRSRAQALADRAAFLLTVVAIVAAAVTLIAWSAAGKDASFVIERVVTVLVIACPHALGLAIPLVVAISTTLGARSGLLIRDRRGLEEARNVTAVFFDKTGTLTRGEFRVVETTTRQGLAPDDALAIAAAVEHDSEHAIAQGVVKSAEERGLRLPKVEHFQALPGRGVQATVDGRTILVGGPALLREHGVQVDSTVEAAIERAATRGQSTVTMIEGSSAMAVFGIADAVRPESHDA